MTTKKHNFDRPLADDAGNIHAAMCSRCGRTIELDGGDIPDATRNEECESENFGQPDTRRMGGARMAFPNDDVTVQKGDRTIQLIDWLVGRLEECLGEALPLQTDDLLKDHAKNAGNSMALAIEQLKRARAKKEQSSE